MSNPARELHEIFSAWREAVPADRGAPLLKTVKVRSEKGIDEMLRVYLLLAEIDRVIRRLEMQDAPVDVFRRQLRVWARIPLALDSGWGSTNGTRDNFMPQNVLDQIETFALYLDGKVLTFSPEMKGSLGELVSQARQTLLEDQDLPPQLREYLHYLLQEIGIALSNEEVGRSFDFAEATRRLWVAMEAAAGTTNDSKSREKWKNLAHSIIVGTVSSGVVEAGAAAIKLAIGQ